jgi:hypothetical protein
MNQEVQKYYSNVPDKSQDQLRKLRQTVLDTLPNAAEDMNYGIPTFKINGHSVVGIGGWNDFVSLYPYGSALITKFKNDLKGLKTTKGAIQFELDSPLPEKIIKKIVASRLKELNIK